MDIRNFSQQQLAKCIQFTKTAPNVTKNEMIKHFELCGEYGFHAAMVPMYYVPMGKEILKGTDVKLATFFGFGMGHETLNAKIAMMKECVEIGADEVDYQPNMSAFVSGDYDYFAQEAQAMLDASKGIIIKPMLELGEIPTVEEKIKAIKIFDNAGFVWIKNSSGSPFGGGDATPEAIKLLFDNVRPECKVKASGKVNSYEKMVALFDAGAQLTGTSSGLDILMKRAGNSSAY